MKKLFITLLICLCFNANSIGQITGSNTVCASYIYTYSINIPGAVNYTWSLPPGWMILSGQGTSQISAFCNTTIDSVCVNAYDASSNLLSHDCLAVSWGGGIGWNTQVTHPGICPCDPVGIMVIPNSSGCPGPCGSGVQSPNTFFAVYSDLWLVGHYLGPANGTGVIQPLPMAITTYYVYLIDTTLGINNAVQITGGACTTTHNLAPIYGCSNQLLGVSANPDTACVGDTVLFQSSTYPGATQSFWYADPGLHLLSTNVGPFAVLAVVTSYSSYPLNVSVTQGAGGCTYMGVNHVVIESCYHTPPVSSFSSNDTSICPSTCINFTNHTQNGVSYQWLFPGANTNTDTSANPQNICYTNPGDYDVTLIVTNQYGSDTLTLNNYVSVHQVNFAPIVNNGDTLFAGNNYVSYQWYEDTTLIPGATNYYYVPHANGNYAVQIVDSNGCEATAFIQGVILSASAPDNERNNFSASYHSNNLNLVFNSDINAKGSIEITNVSGAMVYSERLTFSDKEKHLSIPMNLSKGIYLIRIMTQFENYKAKIVVNE